MVEKRVKILASRKADPSVEERLKCREDLMQQVFISLYIMSMGDVDDVFDPSCPRCYKQKLLRCEGDETERSGAGRGVITWKCPKCGFFLNTYGRIAPESIKWSESDTNKYIDKPKVSAKPQLEKYE